MHARTQPPLVFAATSVSRGRRADAAAQSRSAERPTTQGSRRRLALSNQLCSHLPVAAGLPPSHERSPAASVALRLQVYVARSTILSLIHISEPTRRTPISY